MSDPRDESRQRDARDALRAANDYRGVGDSALGPDAAGNDDNDPTVIWGRRIGRGLALIFVAVLVYVLFNQITGRAP